MYPTEVSADKFAFGIAGAVVGVRWDGIVGEDAEKKIAYLGEGGLFVGLGGERDVGV